MTKNELIKVLQEIEGNPVVVVYSQDNSIFQKVDRVNLETLRVYDETGGEFVYLEQLSHPELCPKEIVVASLGYGQ